ncbi:MAG: hypothetical protein HYR66_05665 [Sphingobacteriales bacterium]|nr:hypothetical protein [Sphingobacteriales bacterium]MBI3717801.1 hypothetical protein [Sphingobacteriales bacterium]
MIVEYNNFRFQVENPSSCPHCHNGIEPREIYNNADRGLIYSIFQCTFRECRKQFVVAYQITGQTSAEFKGFLDGTPIGPHWTDTIKNLKSKFIATYMQALL